MGHEQIAARTLRILCDGGELLADYGVVEMTDMSAVASFPCADQS
jgi:hypothetical protein